MERLRSLYEPKGVVFKKVYVSEAHPIDEWRVYSDVDFCQPTSLEERVAAAKKLLSSVKIGAELYIDTMENIAEAAYSAHPERLYVIDAKGKIAYKGGMGPFGYSPDELEHWLAQHTSTKGPVPESTACNVSQVM